MTNDENQPHPMNAPGPFYVGHGCCLSCDVPFLFAPELFSYDGRNHCYVQRQPRTKHELSAMLRTIFSAETQCIRYRGCDREILRHLGEFGESSVCDASMPADIHPILRNHVTFKLLRRDSQAISRIDIVESFKNHLQAIDESRGFVAVEHKHRFTNIESGEDWACFAYSWFEDNYHSVEIRSLDSLTNSWLIRHSPIEKIGSRAVSLEIDDWLNADSRFNDIRWYTVDQWNGSKEFQETAW